MQLVGEVMGQISDALHKNSVPGFDETNVTNDWGRILLEAAGTAVVAGATGGNIGAATGSYVAGNILASATINAVAKWAVEQTNGDVKSATAITNIVENIIASAGGAAAGGAIGGSSGALNGVGISSSVEQYNFVQAIPLIVEGLTYAYAIIKTWQAIEIANDVNNANQGNQDGSQVNNSANSSAQSTPADPNQQPDPDNDDKDKKQEQNNKPKYEESDVHKANNSKYDTNKTPTPKDAEEAYDRAVQGQDGSWYSVGENGVYRYDGTNGNVHFNAIMETIGKLNKGAGTSVTRQLQNMAKKLTENTGIKYKVPKK